MKEKLNKKNESHRDILLSFIKQCYVIALCLIIIDAHMSGKTDVIDAIEKELEIKCK